MCTIFPVFYFPFRCVRACVCARRLGIFSLVAHAHECWGSLFLSFAHPHKVNYVESIIARLLPRLFGESASLGAVPPEQPTSTPLSISNVPQPFHRSILVKQNRCRFPAYDGCSIREALPMFGALRMAYLPMPWTADRFSW